MLGRAHVRNAPAKDAAARSVAAKGLDLAGAVATSRLGGLRPQLALDVAVLSGHDETRDAGHERRDQTADRGRQSRCNQDRQATPRWPESAPPVPSSMVAGSTCNRAVPFIVGRSAVPLIVRKLKNQRGAATGSSPLISTASPQAAPSSFDAEGAARQLAPFAL